MSHILIIIDAAGKELARVPVTPGYKTKEVRAVDTKKSEVAASEKKVGDSGSGVGKVS